MTAPVPAPTLEALVAGVVDYAGLFPPASLGMGDAAACYATYLASADAWVLGRFVVPSTRLDELAAEAARYTGARSEPWRLSALVSDDGAGEAERVRAFNASQLGRLVVDVAELRAASPGSLEPAALMLRRDLTVYAEVPILDEPRPWLASVKRAQVRAKVRTGGTAAEAFPTAAQLARFLVRCAELELPFKATAGLHHPLRGDQRLTYADDAPSATMFGFLNVFLAGAFARGGMDELTVGQLLEERDADAIAFDHDRVRWRGHSVTLQALRDARCAFAIAFGSCSFREPIDDLRRLALL
jgi:hypothetical protein